MSTAPDPSVADSSSQHEMLRHVWTDPARMSGAPCFRGTRVPVSHLFDYLRAGQTTSEFLRDFQGPTQAQVDAVIMGAAESLSRSLPRSSEGTTAA